MLVSGEEFHVCDRDAMVPRQARPTFAVQQGGLGCNRIVSTAAITSCNIGSSLSDLEPGLTTKWLSSTNSNSRYFHLSGKQDFVVYMFVCVCERDRPLCPSTLDIS